MILTDKPDDSAVLESVLQSSPADPLETMKTRLLAIGVAESRLQEAERIMQDCAFVCAGEMIRRLLRALDGTPAAEALQIAVLGPDVSLTADAARAGTSKQALGVSVKRIKKRINREAGLQPPA